jgi:transcriptional regulator with GAF, ATPase, and Fis domain
MANNILVRRKNTEFLTKMEVLGSTIRALLREATLRAEPVTIDPEIGIDFYENVARFEIHLIESALEMAGGRQNKAAKLLNLRTSTLNWKIKKLDIKSR